MPPRFSLSAIAALLTGFLMFAGGAAALESQWSRTGQADVRLLAAGRVPGGDAVRAGLEIRLADGWHTYWRYPGDAGVPPRFDWSGSRNLQSVDVRYPAPERIVDRSGSQSIGYEHGVIFPLRIRPVDPKQPVNLQLKLDFAVCEKLCVPAQAELTLRIPADDDATSPALDRAEARVPAAADVGDGNDLRIVAVTLERGTTPRAIVDVAAPAGSKFDLFAEGPVDGWALPLPERVGEAEGRTRFAVPIDGAPPGEQGVPTKLRLTLVSAERAVEVLAPLDGAGKTH